MTKNLFILFFCFATSCNYAASKKNTQKENLAKTEKNLNIECLYMGDFPTRLIYTIKNDTLYLAQTKLKYQIDNKDYSTLVQNISFINKTPIFQIGTCLTNDAPGILYKFLIGQNTSKWTACFYRSSSEIENNQDKLKIINILDKYYFYVESERDHKIVIPKGIEIFVPH